MKLLEGRMWPIFLYLVVRSNIERWWALKKYYRTRFCIYRWLNKQSSSDPLKKSTNAFCFLYLWISFRISFTLVYKVNKCTVKYCINDQKTNINKRDKLSVRDTRDLHCSLCCCVAKTISIDLQKSPKSKF